MPTGTVSKSINVGGIGMSGSAVRTKDGQIGHEVALPAADDGVQLAFTSVNIVSVTLAAGNIVEDGDVVDVYWEVDGVLFVNYGAACALAGQVATLTGDTGDDFVTGELTLAMNVVEQVLIDTDFVGDEVEMMAASCDKNGHIEFVTVAPATIDGIKLLENEPWEWVKNGEVTNPLAGETVAMIEASNGDPDAAATVKIGVLYNSA